MSIKKTFEFSTRKNEKGFILIVAITILMGLLAVVTTLIRISQDSTDHQKNYLKTNQALSSVMDTGLGWVEYLFRNRGNEDENPNPLPPPVSSLQKNWWGSGMQGFPFSLYLEDDVDETSSEISVSTLRHIFTSLAVNTKTKIGFLIDNEPDMYVIENGELRVGTGGPKVGGGAPTTYEDVNISNTYGMTTDMQKGYVNIGERWLKVGDWEISVIGLDKHDHLDIKNINLRDDDSTLNAKKGDTINYYPFDPALDIGKNLGSLLISIQDEAGKINVNSLTQSGLKALGFDSNAINKYRDAMLNAKNPVVITPHRNLHSLAFRSQDDVFNKLQQNDKYTIYSKSLIANSPEAFVVRGQPSANLVLGYDLSNTQMLWTKSGSRTKHILTRHALNFNSANAKTIRLFLEGIIGTSTDAADDLAREIIRYRYNDEAVKRYIPNPFDGVDNRDEDNLVYYNSPEEEFRAFLLDRSDLYEHDFNASNSIVKNIMSHVYYEAFDLENRIETISGERHLSQPIGFEWDDTWSISITATSGFDDRPSSTRSKNIVMTPINRSGTGYIFIDSSTGWNKAYSTFSGVTRKQPPIIYDSTNPDRIVIDESNLDEDQLGYYHVLDGMFGRIGQNAGRVEVKAFLGQDGSGNLLYAIDRNGMNLTSALGSTKSIDFGLRPLTEDREDMGVRFASNVINHDAAASSSNTITYGGASLSPNDVEWVDQWLVAGANTGNPHMMQVERISGANIVLKENLAVAVGANEGLVMAPNHHPDYIGQTDVNTNHSFYETVVHAPGANGFKVRWMDSETEGYSAQGVRVYYYSGMTANPVELTDPNAGGDFISMENFIRLRFSFEDIGANDRPQPPQLYGVRIEYRIRTDTPPMYILNQY
jgi:hypothetical protein